MAGAASEPRIEADSVGEARALCDRDPYVAGGLFETTEIFETLQVFPER